MRQNNSKMNITDNMQWATVLSVHDGDSIRVAVQFKDETGKELVSKFALRIGQIDAPEVYAPGYSTDQPFGKEAGQYLRSLVKGKKVAIQKEFKRDPWDRRVSFVIASGKDNEEYGLDVASEMVHNGWAWAGLGAGSSVALQSLRVLQESAKAKKVGLWAGENPIRPSVWRRITTQRNANKSRPGSKWPVDFAKEEITTKEEFDRQYGEQHD